MLKTDYTIWREEEYKELSKLSIYGKVLDLGGSKNSGYHQLIKGKHEIITVNINPDYGCDLIFNIEKKFPIPDKQYDKENFPRKKF